MNNITELGVLVAEQMENVEHDFEGRAEDFEYHGSISILVYEDKSSGQQGLSIRQRTSMCQACSVKVLVECLGDYTALLLCNGDDTP